MVMLMVGMLVVGMLRLDVGLGFQPVLHVMAVLRPMLEEGAVRCVGDLVVHLLTAGPGLGGVVTVPVLELSGGGHAIILGRALDIRHGAYTPGMLAARRPVARPTTREQLEDRRRRGQRGRDYCCRRENERLAP